MSENPEQLDRYKCTSCDEIHDQEDDAIECCQPDVEWVTHWKCTECGSEYEKMKDAEECCTDEGALFRIHQKKLEEAGQLRLFT